MSLLKIITENSGTITGGSPPPSGGTPLVDNSIVHTSPGISKGYNAFAYPSVLSDDSLIAGFKKSDNHAAQGDFAILRSLDGGVTSTIYYVRTAGGIVQTSQCTFYRDSVSGYLYALNVDANTTGNSPDFLKVETYRILESSFIANPSANWTQTNTVDFTGYASGMVIGDLWGDVLKMPSGKLLVPVHMRHTSSARHIALFIESSDDGATWSIGNVILDKVGGGSFPGGSFSEVNPVITEVGASDATTKIVVLLRNESYAYYTHVKSADGGSTFTEDTTTPFGYDFFSADKVPISSKLHGGYIYCTIGSRNYVAPNNNCKLEVLRLSPSDVYNNPNPKTSANLTILKTGTDIYLNVTNNDLIHYGYPMLFTDSAGDLWLMYYDEHDPNTDWLGGAIKTRLIIKKVV